MCLQLVCILHSSHWKFRKTPLLVYIRDLKAVAFHISNLLNSKAEHSLSAACIVAVEMTFRDLNSIE